MSFLVLLTVSDDVGKTPDKPEYKDGTWHIESMMNERIVAGGLYYYDQEYVSVHVRQTVRTILINKSIRNTGPNRLSR